MKKLLPLCLILALALLCVAAGIEASQHYPTQYESSRKDDCRAFYDEGVRLLKSGDAQDTVRSAAFTNASLACVTINGKVK